MLGARGPARLACGQASVKICTCNHGRELVPCFFSKGLCPLRLHVHPTSLTDRHLLSRFVQERQLASAWCPLHVRRSRQQRTTAISARTNARSSRESGTGDVRVCACVPLHNHSSQHVAGMACEHLLQCLNRTRLLLHGCRRRRTLRGGGRGCCIRSGFRIHMHVRVGQPASQPGKHRQNKRGISSPGTQANAREGKLAGFKTDIDDLRNAISEHMQTIAERVQQMDATADSLGVLSSACENKWRAAGATGTRWKT